MEIIAIKKKFDYLGIQIQIVDCLESYMNSSEKITVRRVIAPNNKKVPIVLQRNETLKSIQSKTIDLLNGFKLRGADVVKELTT